MFSTGKFNAALFPLIKSNLEWRESGVKHYHPQKPTIVTGNCGRIIPEEIHDIKELGRVFNASSARGIGRSEASFASFAFPFRHFKDEDNNPTAKVIELIVHDCVLSGVCRKLNGEGDIVAGWDSGLKQVNLPGHKSIAENNLSYAHQTAAQIISFSDEVRELVREGNLIIALTHYNNESGKLSYPSFITSAREGLGLSTDILHHVSEGNDIHDFSSINPVLEQVHSLAIGNKRHVAKKQRKPKRIQYVIDACADARTSPSVVFYSSSFEIEALRGAGNVINKEKVAGIRIAVAEALETQRKELTDTEKPFVTIIEMSHSRCGAINKSLACKGETPDTDKDKPIVKGVWPRLVQYPDEQHKIEGTDPHHQEAARYNAIGACYDIMNFESTDGRQIRKWMREGVVQLVPAVYLLKSGRVQFFDPLPAPVAI